MPNVLLMLLAIPLFFLPKINLISVGDETAGIRVDDIVLALLAIFILKRKLAKHTLTLDPIEQAMTLLLLLMLISNAFNIFAYSNSSFLYTFRIFEYFLFYYIGQMLSRTVSIVKLTWCLLAANGVAMVAQYLGLIGGFASAGYQGELDRMIGLTGGPWEIGTLLNFFFCVLAFSGRYRKRQVLGIFGLTLSLILLTKARQPLAIHLVLYLLYIARGYRSKGLKVAVLAIFSASVVAAFLAFPDNPIVERSAGLLTADNAAAISEQFASQNVDIEDFGGFDELDSSNSEIDLSWSYRLYKWAVIMVSFVGYPTSWGFGFGPGMWGTAVDGGWIRVATETGLIGLALFIALNRRMARINPVMRYVILAYTLNLVMIDVEIAYKVQQFLFFAAGYFVKQRFFAMNKEANGQPGLTPVVQPC